MPLAASLMPELCLMQPLQEGVILSKIDFKFGNDLLDLIESSSDKLEDVTEWL